MADYLFRGGMQHESGRSPAELQASMQKWLGWIGGIGKKGQLKGGQPLENGGKVIAGKQRVVTDGPFAEAKDIVGGYLVVTAKDLAEAYEIAKGCPAPDEGGSVEVRGLAPMPGQSARPCHAGAHGNRGSVPEARRAPVPAPVGQDARRAGAHPRDAQPRARRGHRAGRPRPGPGDVAVRPHPGEPCRVAHGDRTQRSARRPPARALRPAVRARSQLPARQRVDAGADAGRAPARLGAPGRPAADDVLVLPSAPRARGADGAHAEDPLRLRHAGGRPGVPDRERGDGEADRPREGGAARERHALRDPRGRGPPRSTRRRAGRPLPALKRGLPRQPRRAAHPRRALLGGDAAS